MSGAPEESSPSAVSKLENHVIVLGYGLLGIYVVEKLKGMGIPYVVVVRDESLLAFAPEEPHPRGGLSDSQVVPDPEGGRGVEGFGADRHIRR